jgi:hypothetical protein
MRQISPLTFHLYFLSIIIYSMHMYIQYRSCFQIKYSMLKTLACQNNVSIYVLSDELFIYIVHLS